MEPFEHAPHNSPGSPRNDHEPAGRGCTSGQLIAVTHRPVPAASYDHELSRYDAGHGSMVVEEQIDQLARAIDFVARHRGTSPPIDA